MVRLAERPVVAAVVRKYFNIVQASEYAAVTPSWIEDAMRKGPCALPLGRQQTRNLPS